MEIMDRIERLEREHETLGRMAEDAPHKFGTDENDKFDKVCEELRNAYNEAGTDEMDRIVL